MEHDRLQATDERVRQTTETLSAIKIVKLYGWEIPMKRRILDCRDKELKTLHRLGVLEAVMSLVFASSSTIISLVTFACYVTLGQGVLTPKIVFVSLTLLKMLHEPIRRLAEGYVVHPHTIFFELNFLLYMFQSAVVNIVVKTF